jgi:hydrogenase maturation protease
VTAPGRVVVIGIGNEFRRDDGAGPEVIARLGPLAPADVALVLSDGEPTRLIEAWTGASVAVVVDAVTGGTAGPGQLHRFVAPGQVGPAEASPADRASSHGFGLETAIGLSQALGRLPELLVVHAVQGADFGQGAGLSAPVALVIDDLVAAVLAEVTPLPPRPQGNLPQRR